jgi:3-oxoacyl-[acyl-carrier protein] reductase
MKILITGGSSEIALAFAKRRASQGDEIFLTTSDRKNTAALIESYKSEGVAAKVFAYDLSNPSDFKEELAAIQAEGLHALVLNAFQRTPKLVHFHELPDSTLREYIDANIHGNLELIRSVLPGMVERKFGRLVFISSGSVTNGTSRYGAYCLAKAALEGLFLNLAVDYGEFGILSNIIRPGIIATERNQRFWKRSHYVDRMNALIPQMSIGSPDQVAEALDPLLSATSYMNGSVVTVSGGLPLMRSAGLLGL